jgi:hypothetical protein
MKKLVAIGILSMLLLHVAGWYAYFGARLFTIHHEMRQLLKSTPTEKLELIKLTKAEYERTSREDEDEMELNGKMYDIARVELKEGVYFVYALHDGAEDSLLGFLDEVVKRSTTDKKPVPSQLLSFITWIYLPVQNDFKFSCEMISIHASSYQNYYSSIVSVIDAPPPKLAA